MNLEPLRTMTDWEIGEAVSADLRRKEVESDLIEGLRRPVRPIAGRGYKLVEGKPDRAKRLVASR